MPVIRTIVWAVLLIALLLFSLNNWVRTEVRIWENLVVETPLPVVVIGSLLLGLVPMWLLHVARRWHMRKRISALEAAARQPSAALTSTQLDAAGQDGETPAN